MNRPDTYFGRLIRDCVCRGTSVPLRLPPTGGDSQHPAHRGNTVSGPIHSDKFEDLLGIESISRANQAAAFDKITRSSCKRFNSSCSALETPSWRVPLSRAACATQFMMVWAEGSSSRERSNGDWPLCTRSIICCRNSAGYGDPVHGISISCFSSKDEMSAETGYPEKMAKSFPVHGHGRSARYQLPPFPSLRFLGARAEREHQWPSPTRYFSGGCDFTTITNHDIQHVIKNRTNDRGITVEKIVKQILFSFDFPVELAR